ncbi:phage holin family protein [Roseivirga sp.]|nr:phage holin family protein [Roseivirga sp.]
MGLFDFDKLVETLTGYLETKIELLKLDAKEELSGFIAKSLIFLFVLVFAFLTLLLFSLGLSSVLNSYLGSSYLGFLIVGVIYLTLALLVYSQRSTLVNKVKREVIEDSLEEDL